MMYDYSEYDRMLCKYSEKKAAGRKETRKEEDMQLPMFPLMVIAMLLVFGLFKAVTSAPDVTFFIAAALAALFIAAYAFFVEREPRGKVKRHTGT